MGPTASTASKDIYIFSYIHAMRIYKSQCLLDTEYEFVGFTV